MLPFIWGTQLAPHPFKAEDFFLYLDRKKTAASHSVLSFCLLNQVILRTLLTPSHPLTSFRASQTHPSFGSCSGRLAQKASKLLAQSTERLLSSSPKHSRFCFMSFCHSLAPLTGKINSHTLPTNYHPLPIPREPQRFSIEAASPHGLLKAFCTAPPFAKPYRQKENTHMEVCIKAEKFHTIMCRKAVKRAKQKLREKGKQIRSSPRPSSIPSNLFHSLFTSSHVLLSVPPLEHLTSSSHTF